jgi:hypothetical protein
MTNPGSPKGKTTMPLAGTLQALCKCTSKKSDAHIVLTGDGFKAIRAIRSAREARHLIGLSLTAMSDAIAPVIGRHYTDGAIANLESTKRRSRDRVWKKPAPRFKMSPEVSGAYQSLLIAAVREVSHGAIDLRITISKWGVWRVTPIGYCAICGDRFVIKRAGVTRCSWCIRHGQTRRKAIN